MARPEFTYLFPTLVLERALEGTESLNRALRALVLEKEQSSPGVTRSNVGGWHSESDLFTWPSPEVADLRNRIGRAVREYVAVEQKLDPSAFELAVRFDGWANVVRAGQNARPHVHVNANVSGVYYVDAGNGEPRGGELEFLDPRNRPGMFQAEGVEVRDVYRVRPETGMLVLFPSFLYHYTTPYLGPGERICVAFNVVIAKLARSATTTH